MTVAAALVGDRGLVVEAGLADGAVACPDRASAMADRDLAEQARDLPRST